MKKVVQINLNVVVVAVAVIVILAGSVGAFAAIGYVDSKQVSYCPDTTNMEATTVSDAIDVLYENVDYVPVGSIIPFMGTTAPTKYLICNGGVYNISDYPRLAEHIKKDFGSYNKFGGNGTTTFAVPDLRGEFLRGSGTASRNTGSGAAVGTHQDATRLPNIFTSGGGLWVYHSSSNLSNGTSYSDQNFTVGANTGYNINISKSGSYRESSSLTYQATTRPTNTAVNYIIKAK